MYQLPRFVSRLIDRISHLPGIGGRTASRLVFYLLKENQGLAAELAEAFKDFNQGFNFCLECHNLVDLGEEICSVCKDPARDKTLVCVVEDQLDVLALEDGNYHGLYHVLGGELSPHKGVGPQDLNIASLLTRVTTHPEIREVILATNPTVTGEATAEYIADLLKEAKVTVSRIAHGLPFGGDLEYADKETLKQSMKGRRYL
jgi:recombination protein RecR